MVMALTLHTHVCTGIARYPGSLTHHYTLVLFMVYYMACRTGCSMPATCAKSRRPLLTSIYSDILCNVLFDLSFQRWISTFWHLDRSGMLDYYRAASACFSYLFHNMATTKRSLPARKQNGNRYVITLYRVVPSIEQAYNFLVHQKIADECRDRQLQ